MYMFALVLICMFLGVINYSDYFQVLDELTFNLRTVISNDVIYNHYKRDGNVLLSHQSLLLTPDINNSHSLFYTSRQINSSSTEIHFSFNVTPRINYSAGFAFWMFSNPHSFVGNINNNLLGFSPEFIGLGVMFIASPQKDIDDYKWTVYFKYNNGSNNSSDLGLKTITRYNSCIREIKEVMLVRVVLKKTTTSIYLKDFSGINSPCVVNLGKVVEKPFRIGFSTYNGKMDGLDLMSHIQIQRISVINSDVNSKGYGIVPFNKIEERKITKKKEIKDLIKGFPLKHSLENSVIFSLELDVVYYFYLKVFEEFVNYFQGEKGVNCSLNFDEIHAFSSSFPNKIKEKILNILKESMCIISRIKFNNNDQFRGENENLANYEKNERKVNLKITLSKFSSNKVLSELNKYIFIGMDN